MCKSDGPSQRSPRRVILGLSMGILGLWLMPSISMGATVFSDSTFNDADWTLTVVAGQVTGPPTNQAVLNPSSGTASTAQMLSGGSLGPHREITLSPSQGQPNTFSVVYAYSNRVGAVYDPSTQGAISSIDYYESSEIVSSTNSNPPGCLCQQSGLALKQGGVIFFVSGGVSTPPTPNSWAQKQLVSLHAQNFCTFTDYFNCTAHPDFSSSGGPIELGYYRVNSTNGQSFTTVGGLDNWQAVIHTVNDVPASSSEGRVVTALGLALLGGLGLVWRRRRLAA